MVLHVEHMPSFYAVRTAAYLLCTFLFQREINFYLDEDAQRAAMEAVDHSFKMICKLNTVRVHI